MALKKNAFSWWSQSKYIKGGTDNPSIKHHDFLVRDIYANHLASAIADQHSEKGQGHGGSVGGNIAYTLNYIPNHPKALYVLIDYSFTIKTRPKHRPMSNPPECYLQRAINFAPGDPGPHFLFGFYLYKLGKFEPAIEKYTDGIALAPHSAEGLYNRGLTFAKLGRYEEAREDAIKAYSLGYPLRGLKKILKSKGFPITSASQAQVDKGATGEATTQ